MQKIHRKLQFLWIKIILAVFSVFCGMALAILIPLNSNRYTLAEPNPFLLIIYIVCGMLGVFLLSFSIMGISEYVSHFRELPDDTYQSHSLSYKKVMDNESRKQIIECVIEKPGIHYNLLRKKCNMHPGQFRWHIDVLFSYGIIKRKRIGHYVAFFPVIGEKVNIQNYLLKFPLRDIIYQLIQKKPGIISSDIAKEVGAPNQRSKIKYHIDRLISAGLVTFKEKGRRKELFITEKNSFETS
jgi:predicted transcriptional regulator